MFLPISDEAPRDPGTPWITRFLIFLNLAVWISVNVAQAAPDAVGVIPDEIALKWGFVPAHADFASALSSMFLHANLLHLVGNLWFLYLFGDNVELRMGNAAYLACYLLSGLGGTFLHWVFFANSQVPAIGASGAIYGVMGMYFYLFPYNRVRFMYFFIFFLGTVYVSALFAIGYFFLTEAMMGYLSAAKGMESGVGHFAHAGGFVVGFAAAQALTAWGLVRDDGWTIVSWLRGRRRDYRPPAEHPSVAANGRTYVEPEPASADLLLALVRAERMEEARRVWRREAFDDHGLVLPAREMLALALFLDKSGDATSAKDAYERIIAAYPGQQPYEAEAHLALAGMMLSEYRSTGQADDMEYIVGHLRKAIDQHPIPARREIAQRWLDAVENTV
ncbi:MAG: rhomboid family intramembrane serine protease [Planctomycetota bacterium]|nr:rhomboid family intramembrane serine protease [Planctomycetota bacterium]